MKKYLSVLLIALTVSVCIQAQNSKSKDAALLLYKGVSAFKAGNNDEAIDYFEQAIVIDKKNAIAYYYRAAVLGMVGGDNNDEAMLKESIKMYKKSSQIDLMNPITDNDWACTLMKLAKLQGKVKSYAPETAFLLKRTERSGEQIAAYNLACLYSLTGNKKEAIKWLYTTMTKYYPKEHGRLSRKNFDNDADFDNIRSSVEYIEFLNVYFPKTKTTLLHN